MDQPHLFTSECVSMGHPDKVADQISDACVDAFLAQDPDARVAVETLVTTNTIVLAGEVKAKDGVEVVYEKLARKVVHDIGYRKESLGFAAQTCNVHILVHKQSPDISMGVDRAGGELGAGDQGLMFGYACDDTPERMPLPITLARRIIERLAERRQSGAIGWLEPDAKSQVTVEFTGGRARVHTVVVSTQHAPDVSQETIREVVKAEVVRPVMPEGMLDDRTVWHINPTGNFEIGGPHGDSGLTGRKIIVDTYGGWGRHGGGAFSGKDPSKVDRSAAYMARYVARNLVDAGLAKRCEVQLAYAIGVAQPLSVRVDTFGTGTLPEARLARLVRDHFDLSPAGMIRTLDLKRPVYLETARHGHFGRTGPGYTWERSDRADALRAAASAGAGS